MEINIDKLIVAAVTPSLLEKGVVWFSQNYKEIENFRKTNAWWRRNTIIIETGQKISLSNFLRELAELGYKKTWEATHKGEFSQKGGAIRISPVNSEKIYSLEFNGNFVENIFTVSIESREKRPSNPERLTPGSVKDMKIFLPGDFVVHIDHGIGIYRGMDESNYIIEYAAPKNRPGQPDLLYIPELHENRLKTYLGLKTPEIHRLGTTLWELTKKKAKEDIVAYAKELLKSFAERKVVERKPYEAFPDLEEELTASFLYEYTDGQKSALKDVFADLSKNIPMDRIITADVGFGKTEIAIMTAFRTVLNNKQAALIAPTTILVEQHYELFKKRLNVHGVNIERLSRIPNQKEINKTIDNAKTGKVDIIIGTHKLLSKSIQFQNLGLLIVDEEQKFGVPHKEKLKKQNPALDILTMTATPIPRTLNFALSGLRQISQIETPPHGRQEIKTFVLPRNKKIIKEAINFELDRNGQIYFLSNRIHNIPHILEELKSLRIKSRIGTLHGRMNEKSLVKTMHDFREHKLDLLVSTTIIENGLDLSNVNTLIVDDSTKLGLAQAHQLRGRIGRGEKKAYAYFLYPTQRLKEKAADRLEALERYSWLGAGVEIAKRDLELRGAGNILGRAQTGVAYKIGLNLYFQLLEEAVEELKNKETKI